MRDKPLIIPDEILEKIEAVFTYRQSGPYNARYLSKALKEFLKQPMDKVSEWIKGEFKNNKGLDPRTIGKAINHSPDRMEWGAVDRLRNLLCYYCFSKSWEDTLVDFHLTEEQVRERDQKKRKEKNTLHSKKTNKTPDILPFAPVSENYKILILPFRNPDKNHEITWLGQNLTDGLNVKNSADKLGLEVKYWSTYKEEAVTYDIARNIGKELNADIVIWGNDSKPEDTPGHVICFHYVALSKYANSGKIPFEGRTNMFQIERLINISYGEIQLEIDDIIHWFVGSKYFWKEDYVNSLKHFERISDNATYRNEIFHTHIGYCLFKLKRIRESVDYFYRALSLKPDYLHANIFLAQIFANHTTNKKGADYYYKRAIELSPNSGYLHHNYACFLFENKKIKEAEQHFEETLKINSKSARTHYSYATSLVLYTNKKELAEHHFLEALKIEPKWIHVRMNYASLLALEFHDKERAEKQYLESLKINPNSASTHYGYAQLLITMFHDKDKAREYLDRALKIEPKFAEAHLLYATLLSTSFNDWENAKKYYLDGIKLNPMYRSFIRDLFYTKQWASKILAKIYPDPSKKRSFFNSKRARLLMDIED